MPELFNLLARVITFGNVQQVTSEIVFIILGLIILLILKKAYEVVFDV